MLGKLRTVVLCSSYTDGAKLVTNAICKSCFHKVRCIDNILPYITAEVCKTLVQALVISRLDYGSVLLYSISLTNVSRMRSIQNCVARLVSRTRKRENITPVFRQLHLASSELQIMVQR